MPATMLPSTPVHELPLVPLSRRNARHGLEWFETAFLGRNDTGERMAGAGDLVRFLYPRVPQRFNRLFDTIIEGWTGETIMVTTPRMVRELYTLPPGFVDHEITNKFLVYAIGSQSPFILNGRDHAQVRKAIVPEFTAGNVQQYHELSVQVLDRMISGPVRGRARQPGSADQPGSMGSIRPGTCTPDQQSAIPACRTRLRPNSNG
jgi:hypothetical protein